MDKRRFNLRQVARIFACLAVTAFFTASACDETNDDDDNRGGSTNGTFKLKVFQGFDIPNKRVIAYGDNSSLVDFQFYFQQRVTGPYPGLYVYLGASKICEFENEPTGISATQVDGWESWTVAPSPNKYYVIRARDRRYYLFHLLKYENQGKASSYWEMTFDWKEISVK